MVDKEKMEHSLASLTSWALEESYPGLCKEVVVEGNRITVMTSTGIVYEIYVEKC